MRSLAGLVEVTDNFSTPQPSNSIISTEVKHYLEGGNGTFADYTVTLGSAGQQTSTDLSYWHKDHLGSLIRTSDSTGNLQNSYSYAPFGARQQSQIYNANGTISPITGIPTDRRGFTGHEMLDELGLVHMNGRVYDPVIGRFLSPDPTIQYPEDMQSYNRYSYVRNNPLSVTDPTGYEEPTCGFFCSIGGFLTGGTTVTAGGVGVSFRAPTTMEMFSPTGWAMYPASASTFITKTSTAGCVASNSCQKAWEPVKEFVGREYIPFTGAGESAAQYWADKAVDADKRGSTLGYYGYSVPGAFASLWTSTTAVDTFTTLAGARMGGRGAAAAESGGGFSLSRLFGRSPCCFAAGTLVATPEGRRAIESLKIGDLVLTKLENNTGESFYAPITATHKRDDQAVYTLTLVRTQKGNQKFETLQVTASHPFWVEGKGFVPAIDLMPDDRLSGAALNVGESIKVVSFVLLKAQDITYNLTVDVGHTFYVGEFDTWVHNTGPCKKAAEKAANLAVDGAKQVVHPTPANSPNLFEAVGKGKNKVWRNKETGEIMQQNPAKHPDLSYNVWKDKKTYDKRPNDRDRSVHGDSGEDRGR